MNDTVIIKSIFIFICFWAVGLGFLWFRPKLELFWKIVATLIFAFYIWFFNDELNRGYQKFELNWYVQSIQFIKELLMLVFVNLFFFWPLCLVLIFFKSDDIGAERLLKFLCILTLVLWVVFIIYFYLNKGIDKFFMDSLRQMIPYAK